MMQHKASFFGCTDTVAGAAVCTAGNLFTVTAAAQYQSGTPHSPLSTVFSSLKILRIWHNDLHISLITININLTAFNALVFASLADLLLFCKYEINCYAGAGLVTVFHFVMLIFPNPVQRLGGLFKYT